ncbi:protein of unknown function [Rhodovastum atsumiense]|uniref:cobalamin-dependent protein n=1 Tax=Rhodovastum atsumiense TaxID=504468 RepID=UPI001EEFAD83|nr:cobalamin-dependent protein [Rhodovastum atsumiense]CAH2602098.1 protein of unknown function [Rhodovastum atsumiense]
MVASRISCNIQPTGGAAVKQAWAAYLTGYLKNAGYTDVVFIDAMTNHLSDEQVRARLIALKPDIVGATAITPVIYKAEGVLRLAKELDPDCVAVLGGIHWHLHVPAGLDRGPLDRCGGARSRRRVLHPY